MARNNLFARQILWDFGFFACSLHGSFLLFLVFILVISTDFIVAQKAKICKIFVQFYVVFFTCLSLFVICWTIFLFLLYFLQQLFIHFWFLVCCDFYTRKLRTKNRRDRRAQTNVGGAAGYCLRVRVTTWTSFYVHSFLFCLGKNR